MSRTIEFLFDFVSPATYLAWKRIPALEARTGARVSDVPVFLGGIMQATGNRPPATVPAKGAWLMADLMRTAARDGVPFVMNPHFPVNTLLALRVFGLIEDRDAARRYGDAVFDAVWRDREDASQPRIVGAALMRAGLDPDLVARAGTEEAKGRIKANTEAAVARGVFGAPTFFVGDQMHFGQDRMDWVEVAART
jgi:2-hydroxychromene-2-carboxylate isomerase